MPVASVAFSFHSCCGVSTFLSLSISELSNSDVIEASEASSERGLSKAQKLLLLCREGMNGKQQQSGTGNMAVGCCLALLFYLTLAHGQETSFPLLMPMVHPLSEETYICTPIRLSQTQTFYVTGFTPNATQHTAHHMLVSFGLSN